MCIKCIVRCQPVENGLWFLVSDGNCDTRKIVPDVLQGGAGCSHQRPMILASLVIFLSWCHPPSHHIMPNYAEGAKKCFFFQLMDREKEENEGWPNHWRCSYKGKTTCLILCSVDYLSERSNAWISHWTYKGIGYEVRSQIGHENADQEYTKMAVFDWLESLNFSCSVHVHYWCVIFISVVWVCTHKF